MRCRGEADYNTSLGVNSRCFEGTDDGPKGEGDTVGKMAIPIVDAMENDVGGGERELAVGDGVEEVADKLKERKVERRG